MARFKGVVGFSVPEEISPGVWDYSVTERVYKGDILKNNHSYSMGENVLGDPSRTTTISIVADKFAIGHFRSITHIKLDGVSLIVTNVEVNTPRLTLVIGGEYNGPTN
jgi:hypothetical protein